MALLWVLSLLFTPKRWDWSFQKITDIASLRFDDFDFWRLEIKRSWVLALQEVLNKLAQANWSAPIWTVSCACLMKVCHGRWHEMIKKTSDHLFEQRPVTAARSYSYFTCFAPGLIALQRFTGALISPTHWQGLVRPGICRLLHLLCSSWSLARAFRSKCSCVSSRGACISQSFSSLRWPWFWACSGCMSEATLRLVLLAQKLTSHFRWMNVERLPFPCSRRCLANGPQILCARCRILTLGCSFLYNLINYLSNNNA